eukprot:6186559-Pleurochrysis_carterae.AAC.10
MLRATLQSDFASYGRLLQSDVTDLWGSALCTSASRAACSSHARFTPDAAPRRPTARRATALWP